MQSFAEIPYHRILFVVFSVYFQFFVPVSFALIKILVLLSRDVTRPAGHEAKAEARKSEAEDEAEAQKFFEAEATMYEAEARCHEAEIEAEARKSEAEAE